VENTESIPQNGVTEIDTTPAPNDIAKEADESRTEAEIKFADESNPNQKARVSAAPDEYDQDGNERGGGKSYGVAAEDLRGQDLEAVQEFNKGEKQEPESDPNDEPVFLNRGEQVDTINQNDTNDEMTEEDQKKLEDKFSRPKDNITARVSTSVGHNVRIKFFRRGLPFVIYKSRAPKLNAGEVNRFLDRQLELRGE
jgi:predicted DNA binding CopG/RHH family protein